MNWRVIIEKDSDKGLWEAWCPELPGCTSSGGSRDEVLVSIREAIEVYLEQRPLPLPPDAEIQELAV